MVCQVNQYICHKGLSDTKAQPRKCSQNLDWNLKEDQQANDDVSAFSPLGW